MEQQKYDYAAPGCLGGILAGLFGVVVGFIVGFLSFGVFIPFEDPHGEAAKWLPGIAILCGIGCSIFGGILGIITGAVYGAEAAIRAFATKGILRGLSGVAMGYLAGLVLSGLRDWQWAFLTDASIIGALLGGTIGIVLGTIGGAKAATRAKHEPKSQDHV
jgi:hypothetical protein